ncbi:hypothetical protein ACFVX9_30625 [Kitasatospora sp. NPDC058243]|uniref:hypothetical protein n=1 Tax=Kitasatospora sp. NPDC058243 TaxID=3346397 RepID=UPI0036DEB875
MKAYTFWSERSHARTIDSDGSLYIEPNGTGGDEVVIYRNREMTDDQMLAIADRVLADVRRWRNKVAEKAKQTHTVRDELAAAQARIAELERATKGGSR